MLEILVHQNGPISKFPVYFVFGISVIDSSDYGNRAEQWMVILCEKIYGNLGAGGLKITFSKLNSTIGVYFGKKHSNGISICYVYTKAL